MKIDNYMCPNCFVPKAFNPINNTTEHKCPNCGKEMEFWCSEEIDSITGKVIPNETEISENIDINYIVTGKPTITCPYCQSDNTKKITTTSKVINTALWGIFGTKRHKQWHCNSCGSDF